MQGEGVLIIPRATIASVQIHFKGTMNIVVYISAFDDQLLYSLQITQHRGA